MKRYKRDRPLFLLDNIKILSYNCNEGHSALCPVREHHWRVREREKSRDTRRKSPTLGRHVWVREDLTPNVGQNVNSGRLGRSEKQKINKIQEKNKIQKIG